MKPLPKEYSHQEAEQRWQAHWLAAGTYHFQDDQPRERTFVIDTPPPTVSGLLHMGHIFSYTQADFVARYMRMSGRDVFYPMGFDDNGLPTERLVEKTKNVRGSAMPRADFVALCREVVVEAENEFRRLFQSTALSVDWRKEYQTISDDVRALSQASFLDLYNKGEAYRDFRPTYWDWVDQTAIASAEIENKDMQGVMLDLQFTLEDGTPITIATTRPELLGACVAVMYHPDDANAARYKDKYAVTPLFGVKVRMIADEMVDKEFGSGLVMCCTYGDDTDKEWQRKHQLPVRTHLKIDGRLGGIFHFEKGESEFDISHSPEKVDYIAFIAGKDGAAEKSAIWSKNCIDLTKAVIAYQAIEGLKPKQANAKILELLEAAGLILNRKTIQHAVKCAERSGTPIEIIPTHQWFIRITDKKQALLAKGSACEWHPEYMQIRLNQWIEGLKEDWCISRQRFFGVPFPVWYSKRAGEEGKIIVADVSQLPVDPLTDLPTGYTREEVEPALDVMDTWATSSISPQINAGSLAQNKLFPADLRPQAHEIIRTWAFYTIAKAHLHADCIPWKHVMISGWCLAADKTKMSKSKGNVVTPLSLIEEKGSDAVRYWASTSRLGTDTAFSEDVLKIGRKLVTKLWNASQLVARVLEAAPATAPADITAPLDRWIVTRLHRAVAKATAEFERFEYCDARVAVEDFFWNDFCDNYLELVKARAYGGQNPDGTATPVSEADQRSAQATLNICLDATLRLFAPFVPHVTEEIYSHLFEGRGSIHARGNWPSAAEYATDEQAEASGIAGVEVLNVIRKAKSEAGVSIKFPATQVTLPANLYAQAAPLFFDLKSAGNVIGDIVPGDNIAVTLAPKEHVA